MTWSFVDALRKGDTPRLPKPAESASQPRIFAAISRFTEDSAASPASVTSAGRSRTRPRCRSPPKATRSPQSIRPGEAEHSPKRRAVRARFAGILPRCGPGRIRYAAPSAESRRSAGPSGGTRRRPLPIRRLLPPPPHLPCGPAGRLERKQGLSNRSGAGGFSPPTPLREFRSHRHLLRMRRRSHLHLGRLRTIERPSPRSVIACACGNTRPLALWTRKIIACANARGRRPNGRRGRADAVARRQGPALRAGGRTPEPPAMLMQDSSPTRIVVLRDAATLPARPSSGRNPQRRPSAAAIPRTRPRCGRAGPTRPRCAARRRTPRRPREAPGPGWPSLQPADARCPAHSAPPQDRPLPRPDTTRSSNRNFSVSIDQPGQCSPPFSSKLHRAS